MKLVLTQDVPNLGKTHDVVDVKSGYGRNFLLPRGLATFLTPGLEKAIVAEKVREDEKRAKIKEQVVELTKKLDGMVLQMRRKTAKSGKLYGSISKSMIAKALKNEHGIDLPASVIKLDQPIREIGTNKIEVELGKDLHSTLTLRIAAEK